MSFVVWVVIEFEITKVFQIKNTVNLKRQVELDVCSRNKKFKRDNDRPSVRHCATEHKC